MLAAVKANGTTTIENAAKEPEISNIATFLNNMGAKITGAGTSIIQIEGVNKLHKAYHEVIPDRIEAGTYIIIASLIGENLKVSKLIPSHLESLTSKLKESGVDMEIGPDYVQINNTTKHKKIDITTLIYPGFPTDLQQIMTPYLSTCQGCSTIEETIYENRFQNIKELEKMGLKAKVSSDNKQAKIYGITKLHGADVCSTDLRGGASLLVAALIAEGTTTIDNINYILRGYDKIVEKLKSVGAKIELI